MPSPSEKHFLYHLIISQLYHDGFGPHATLLEEAALQTNRAIAPSDRLKRMLSACAYTVREVDEDFERRNEANHKDQQKSVMIIGERPMRSTTPSPYHTLARRRLTAAKRHSVLSISRGKHFRPNSRSILTSQKISNLSLSSTLPSQQKPMQTNSSGISQPTSGHTPPGIQVSTLQATGSGLAVSLPSGPSMAPNVSVLQNLFSPPDGSIFNSTAHKDQSAEAVRVLQNIFQKRDILPAVPIVQSDMSQDLNSLIQASTDVITSGCPLALPTPTVSVSASTSSEPTTEQKPLQDTPPKESDAMIEEPPPLPIISVTTMEGTIEMDSVDALTSTSTSPTTSMYVEEYKSDICDSPKVKEEIQDEDDIQYPANSQDIINQLNSLSATGMSNTNLQNLANSLSSGLADHQENHLNTLSNLSMNLSESLASSLNLSVPGLDSKAGPSSAVSSLNQTFSGMTPSKMDLYNRLECGDKPSMLSMVNSQRPLGSNPAGSSSQDWGATGEEKFYQCPYCPKVYTTTQSLHRHKHSHTGTNMKACPLCGKTSYRVDNLKSHIRNCYKKRLRMENLGGSDCSLES